MSIEDWLPMLSEAFPGFGTPADLLEVSNLDPAANRRLRRRVAAVLAWSKGEMIASKAAEQAELSRRQFYKIAADWRAKPVLASMALRTRVPDRRPSRLGDAGIAAERVVQELLAANPDMPTAQVLRRMRSAGIDAASDTTLHRMVAKARRPVRTGLFGERVILDNAGMDLVDAFGRRLRLYAVIDAGTGLVLKAVERHEGGGARMYAAVLHDTHSVSVHTPELAIPAYDGEVGLDVRISPDDRPGIAAFAGVRRLPAPARVAERVLGKAVVRALGDLVGGVWIGTGTRPWGVGYRSGRMKGLPVLDDRIQESFDAAVRRHNVETLGRLGRASAAGAEAALGRIRDRLEEVAALVHVMEPLPPYMRAAP